MKYSGIIRWRVGGLLLAIRVSRVFSLVTK
jgi:hypothetical protein